VRDGKLEELGELCIRIDETLTPAIEEVTPLSEYAARFRYPGAPWKPTFLKRQDAISIGLPVGLPRGRSCGCRRATRREFWRRHGARR
jgi:hypothetical protein